MNSFYNLLRDGIFTQVILVTGMTVTIAVLVLSDRAVPELISLSFSAILGYYFRAQTSQDNKTTLERSLNERQ